MSIFKMHNIFFKRLKETEVEASDNVSTSNDELPTEQSWRDPLRDPLRNSLDPMDSLRNSLDQLDNRKDHDPPRIHAVHPSALAISVCSRTSV